MPWSSHLSKLRASSQVCEQRGIKRLGSPVQLVVDPIAGRAFGQRIDMRANLLQILVTQDVGQNVKLLFGLGVFKNHRVDEIEIKLLLVQHVKHDYVVAAKAQVLQPVNDLLRLVVQVRDHYDNRSPRKQISRAVQQVRYRSPSAGRESLDHTKHGSQMT